MLEKIVITPYNPAWPKLFMELGTDLRAELGKSAIRIDHIGSTAVPGLDAKPIIDIQISVDSFEPLDGYRLPLEKLGYIFREGNPDLSKRYFREAPGQRRTHIHVRRWGSWPEQQALSFRDYMRAHPADGKLYAELKHALAGKYAQDRAGYTDAKSSFIWKVIRKADA
jgi:GrpB-like predicted nucleotidyltransferase (UPF0157 family)